MTVKELYKIIDNYAPFNIAMEHDNSGLLIGKENCDVTKVLITLDADLPALEEAVKEGCNTIVSHHPFFFEGEKQVTDQSGQGAKILYAVENHLNIICAHTNLDSCKGGINDTLGKRLGLIQTECFLPTANGGFLGRVGTHHFQNVEEFLKNAVKALNCTPRYIVANDKFERIAWVSGSGSSCMEEAIQIGADTLVTGDCKYSAFMNAKEAGINLIDLGHFETEQIIVPVIAQYLKSNHIQVVERLIPSPVLTLEEQ